MRKLKFLIHSYHKFVIVTVLLSSFILGLSTTSSTEGNGRGLVSKRVPSSEFEFTKETERLGQMFTTLGTEQAYEFFAKEYQVYPQGPVHELAHWIGIEIFKREGLEGVLFCDESYSWGCHHGFVIQALAEEGEGILEKVEDACKKGDSMSIGGCIHGIGHGVLSIRGYDLSDLLSALSSCDLLSTPEVAEGCYNGVFMEYNLKTMEVIEAAPGEGEKFVRDFNPENPFAPCDALAPTYQKQCYAELPEWWRIVLGGDFKKMSSLCASVETKYAEECFKGIGVMTPIVTNYQPEEIDQLCRLSPNAATKALCIYGAVEVFIHDKKEEPLRLCNFLDGGRRQNCITEGKKLLCQTSSKCE